MGAQLFIASFSALFLELMVIRWVPSVIRMVAYYANLMLLSSFLGMGIGMLLGKRPFKRFEIFPLLIFLQIALMVVFRHAPMPVSAAELRFGAAAENQLLQYAALVAIFIVNAAVFVPLGHKMGSLFERMPPLKAYAFDLGGSLLGTLSFAVFSFWSFSPLVGVLIVAALYSFLCKGKSRWIGLALFLCSLSLMRFLNDPGSTWSPYYHISAQGRYPVRLGSYFGRWFYSDKDAVPLTSDELRSMKNPPLFMVRVNQDFYHFDMSIDPRRYTGKDASNAVSDIAESYWIPYLLAKGRKRALILGAGGGNDAEAAVLSGVEKVDAVEIDPLVIALSRRLGASGIYDNARVSIHEEDARAFLRSARPGYDLVEFGLLDSQALFSQMSNIRLDGYVYTVESFRTAYSLLSNDGLLAISFMADREWLALKLIRMIYEAVGKMPIVYGYKGQIVLCVPRGEIHAPPEYAGHFRRVQPPATLPVEPSKDDWPFLYLSKRTIPIDYLTIIGLLMAVSFASVLSIGRKRWGAGESHFFFLGFAFLLLETSRIGDCSLYFGTTWLVTALVVAGILLMALAANAAALSMKRFSFALYIPLGAALLIHYLMPRDEVLSWSMSGRLLWTLLAVPLPVFFAGLIFSLSFKERRNPSGLLGANLIGAMAGGFSEYLSMAAGQHALELLIFLAYGASLVSLYF